MPSNSFNRPVGLVTDGLGLLVLLALLLMTSWVDLALAAKQCHDRGETGAWVLLQLLPIVGPIWATIELGCRIGTLGPNRYGPAAMGMSGGVYGDFADVFG